MNTVNKSLSFAEIFRSIYQSKFKILNIALITSGLTFLTLLITPNYYTSDSFLAASPELNTNDAQGASGLLGAVGGGLASTLGFDAAVTPMKEKILLAEEIITSRDFFRHLLTFDSVPENIVAFRSYSASQKKSIFKRTFNSEEGEWKIKVNEYGVPDFEKAYKKYLRLIDIKDSAEGDFLRIKVTHRNPYFAFYLHKLIINEMNSLEQKRNLDLANASLLYLEKEIEKYKFREIQNSIYFLIENQLKDKMYSSTRNEYLLTIIDSPFLPENKSFPARFLLTVLSFVLAITFASAYYSLRDFNNQNS